MIKAVLVSHRFIEKEFQESRKQIETLYPTNLYLILNRMEENEWRIKIEGGEDEVLHVMSILSKDFENFRNSESH